LSGNGNQLGERRVTWPDSPAGQLSTVNGSVKATFSELKKSVSLKSVNGSVTVALPSEANAKVSANTLTGGINSDFGLQAKKHFPIGQNLDGKLGGGGPAIDLSTVTAASGSAKLWRGESLILEEADETAEYANPRARSFGFH
jgi:hypothetical protein